MQQFAGIEDTYRMYGVRGFELVTVAANGPEDRAAVQQVLEKQHATSRNLMSASARAFDPAWDSSVPSIALITRDGRMAYRRSGAVDMLELRRTILANIDWEYEGFSRYWGK